MQETATCGWCKKTPQTCPEIVQNNDEAATSLCWKMQGWSRTCNSKKWRCGKCVGWSNFSEKPWMENHKYNYPDCYQRHITTHAAAQLAASSCAEAVPPGLCAHQPWVVQGVSKSAHGSSAHGGEAAPGDCEWAHSQSAQGGEAAPEDYKLGKNLNELRQVNEDEGLRATETSTAQFIGMQKELLEMKELLHELKDAQAWLRHGQRQETHQQQQQHRQQLEHMEKEHQLQHREHQLQRQQLQELQDTQKEMVEAMFAMKSQVTAMMAAVDTTGREWHSWKSWW